MQSGQTINTFLWPGQIGWIPPSKLALFEAKSVTWWSSLTYHCIFNLRVSLVIPEPNPNFHACKFQPLLILPLQGPGRISRLNPPATNQGFSGSLQQKPCRRGCSKAKILKSCLLLAYSHTWQISWLNSPCVPKKHHIDAKWRRSNNMISMKLILLMKHCRTWEPPENLRGFFPLEKLPHVHSWCRISC